MSVWGISRVKDEADIIESTVSRMVAQVDRVLIADNGSTDGTVEILDSLDIDLVEDREVAYYQSRAMSALAAAALDAGADWIVPFDADEVWVARGRKTLKQALEAVPEDVRIVEADLYDHVATALDPRFAGPMERMAWRRPSPAPLPKVACRAHETLTIHQGNHGASYADHPVPLRLGGLLYVRHFLYRSVEQMISKARNGAAAYAATDLPEDVGAHWRQYGRFSDGQIGDIFREHFWSADPRADGLVYDPA